MKGIIIYASFHHKNTEKIARAMGSVLGAKTIDFTEAGGQELLGAGLIGFGSGIYYGKFHKGLLNFAKNLPETNGQKAFIFSTAGVKQIPFLNSGHKSIREILRAKNFNIVGEFDCPGYDTNSLLKCFGGINGGRPNKEDIKRAKDFARGLCRM